MISLAVLLRHIQFIPAFIPANAEHWPRSDGTSRTSIATGLRGVLLPQVLTGATRRCLCQFLLRAAHGGPGLHLRLGSNGQRNGQPRAATEAPQALASEILEALTRLNYLGAVTSEASAIKTSILRCRQSAWAAATCIARRVVAVNGSDCCHAAAGDAR